MGKFVAFNVPVTVGTTVLTDHVARVSVELSADAQESTPYGTSGFRERLGGLKDGQVSIDFHQDFAAASVNAIVASYFGGTAAVVVGGTALGTAAVGTAVCLINDFKPHASAVGDLATMQITWPTTGAVTGFGLS